MSPLIYAMKAMIFHEVIPLNQFDNPKDHYVLVFGLTSRQDPTESRPNPELFGEPLRLELNFAFPLQHVTELIALGERKSSVAVDKVGVVGKKCLDWIRFLSSKRSIVSRYSQFCNTATQQNAGRALGNDCKVSSPIAFCRLFRRIHFPQAAVQADDDRTSTVSAQRLQFLHKICSFSYFHVWQEEITWVHDVNLLSFINQCM